MNRWLLIAAADLTTRWGNVLSTGRAQAQNAPSATVLSIGDGDTIRVQQGQQRFTVRLACIDAPEMAQAPYGAHARSYLLTRRRPGSSVTLQPQTVDRFRRTVEVFSPADSGKQDAQKPIWEIPYDGGVATLGCGRIGGNQLGDGCW